MSKKKSKIMIVDDIEINRAVLSEILSDEYEIIEAADGNETLSVLFGAEEKPQILLLDVLMPGMDGYTVNRAIKADNKLKHLPVIFITSTDDEQKGLSEGAVDFISKPFDPEIVKLRVANHIELSAYREQLEKMVEDKTKELIDSKERFLETMADLIEYRSLESGQHVCRTKEMARLLVNHLIKSNRYAKELIDGDCETMIKAVPLHDIGKVAIPDNILLKPGKLTPEEFKVIESHTIIGGQAIKSLMLNADDIYLNHCYDICRYHHEHWDGLGYPHKLSGEHIPLSARIVAVVDVYDALISKRCYKDALSHEDAMRIITLSSGSHFDPVIVDALVEISEDFRTLAAKLA